MKSRLLSVDVFRGLTVIMMTLVNNPGDWDHVYPPLLHAEWHGCTPTDLVFPFFLFIVGISIVLANPKKVNSTDQDLKIIGRFCRIFGLGLFLNFFSHIELTGFSNINLLIFRLFISAIVVVVFLGDFKNNTKLISAAIALLLMFVLAFWGPKSFETVRIPGVLQRIALVYLVVSLLYSRCRLSTLIVFCVLFLVLYYVLMSQINVPGIGPANFEKGTNLAAWFDNLILENHLWSVAKTWDPEGLLSTIPAFSTGLLGVFVGLILNSKQSKKTMYLVILGTTVLGIGLIVDTIFPINKALWSSSFVCFTAGLATLVLSIFYVIIDVYRLTNWTHFFVVFGVNPMVVFFFSGIVPRSLSMIEVSNRSGVQQDIISYLYTDYIKFYIENPYTASLVGGLVYIVIWYIILTVFYRKNLLFKV